MPTLSLILILLLSRALLAGDPAPSAQAGPEPTKAAPPAPAADPVPYQLDRGPFEVDTIELTLRDKDRDKELPLLVRVPREARTLHTSTNTPPRPLIIFSHGMGGSSDAFATLSAHWASHGYVVVHPTHDDSVKLRRAKGEQVTAASFLAAGTRQVDPIGRAKDIKLILDRLDEIETRTASQDKTGPRTRIDRDRVCMASHSAGAFTTQMIAGVKMGGRFTSRRAAMFADPRIKAFMPISPQGVGKAGMTKDSWSAVTLPMLAITGSEDISRVSDETPETRRHCFDYSAATGHKYLLWIEGATHASFGGKPGDPPKLRAAVDTAMKCVTTAFLDAHLRDHASAQAWLNTTTTIRSLTNGTASLESK